MNTINKYKADIVICVHNALEDVKMCVESIYEKTNIEFQLIIINDGSDLETSTYLKKVKNDKQNFILIENDEAIGYTKSANLGLRKSVADKVVLMNSDVIVTEDWLSQLVDCADSDINIGLVGPISNAASWQSVPDRFDSNGDWAINEIPEGTTLEEYSTTIKAISQKKYPRVKLLNGVCTLYTRNVLNRVGYLDEENFPRGYGEENDYCLRAVEAGFDLVIDESTYIFHAKSKSFGHETRKELSKAGSQALTKKHGKEKLKEVTKELRFEETLQTLRMELKKKFSKKNILEAKSLAGNQKILFLLPVSGIAGGIHSIFQEVMGMRKVEVDAKIATWRYNEEAYFNAYPNVDNLLDHFFFFNDFEELIKECSNADVVVATINHSIILLKRIYDRYPNILPVYYVQDYEPFFFEKGNVDWKIAFDSYSLIEDIICIAKTNWLCDAVQKVHNVTVEKVSPSLDTSVYYPNLNMAKDNNFVTIVAMVRPSTPRRGAERTMRVLKQIKDVHKKNVEIKIFGTPDKFIDEYNLETDFKYENLGIINREQVSEVMRNSDIFIDFSIYQAFGRTGLEAMACGCAAVLTDRGGTDEYAVHNHNSLLIDTTSDQSCFEALNSVIVDKSLREKFIFNGTKDASNYSIRRSVISELLVFNKYLKDRKSKNVIRKDYSEADRFYNKKGELIYDLTSIIILLNKEHMLNKFSFSSIVNSLRKDDELIILNNNSAKNNISLINEFNNEQIRIIDIGSKVTFNEALNIGVEESINPYLCFISPNLTVPSKLLYNIGKYTANKKIGAVAPLLNLENSFQNITNYTSDILSNNSIEIINNQIDKQNNGELILAETLSLNCLLVRKEVFQKVDCFNFYNKTEFVELDFTWWLKKAGFSLGVTLDTFCYMDNSKPSSTTHTEREIEQDKEKLFRLLIENYGAGAVLSPRKIWGIDNLNFDSILNKRKLEVAKENKNRPNDNSASIVILTYNSSKTIDNCLSSVLNTIRELDEIIIVDNGSEDDTCQIVKSIIKNKSQARFIINKENLGFSEGTNVGIRNSTKKFVVFLNPDTIVANNWITNLTSHFDDESIGAVGPISNYVAGYQKMELYSNREFEPSESLDSVYDYFSNRNNRQSIETKLLIGFCLAIKKETLDKYGYLDKKLFLGNDDLDLSWRLRENGLKLLVALDTFVYHEGQQSFNTKPNVVTRKLVQESSDELFIKLQNYYGKGKVPSSKDLWGINWFTPSSNLLQGEIVAESEISFTSIIALTFNQLKYTKEFVESVQKHTTNYELIIVDNNSTDGTKKYLNQLKAQHSNVKIINNSKNNGFPKAVNQAILETSGDHIVIANNDIVVSNNWLEKMIRTSANDPKIGIVGPTSNSVSGVQIDKDASYSSIEEMHKYAKLVSKKNKGKIEEFPRVAFLCTLIKKDVIEKIGGLDERFSPGNFEDDDFCLRTQLAGYKTIIAKDVFIHHYGSVSFKANGNSKYAERLKINEQKFMEKWGSNPEGIWLKGHKPKSREIKYPIDNDLFTQSLKRAFIDIDNEEYNLAIENLQLAINEFKNSSRVGFEKITQEDLLNMAGNIALSKNELEEAKLFFEKELENSPNSSQACFGLGEVFKKAEMFEESKAMFEWAVINDTNNKNAQIRLEEVNKNLNLPKTHNSILIETETEKV